MATYRALDAAGNKINLTGGLMDSGTGCDVTAVFSFLTSGLATPHKLELNDKIELAKIPKGAVITDFLITMPDVDSSNTLRLDLGLTTQDPNAFVAAADKGKTAGDTLTPEGDGVQATGVPLECTCASGDAQTNGYDVFALVAQAASTGAGAGGTIKGWVRYNLHGSVR